ncbi:MULTISPECIES: hypothetical protein [Mycobacterium]|uniref:hypothetical protein n=1 Tax=Mycobacterium TaxID=1763 RepID=UPI000683FF5B|nr:MULTISPECIES: hypothetical protein [Mycobacterium]
MLPCSAALTGNTSIRAAMGLIRVVAGRPSLPAPALCSPQPSTGSDGQGGLLFGSGGGTPMPGSLIGGTGGTGGTGGASAGNPPGSPGEDGNAGIVGAGGLLIGG